MASPPFNPNELVPEDDDVVSLFPALERTFRDIVESWLLIEHSRYGYHQISRMTTAVRDAETNWTAGALVYNTTLSRLQIATGADPDVWATIGPEFDSGVRIVYQQTSAPTGWTKESSSSYNDALPVGTTGTVSTSGATAVSSVLTSRTIAQANLPAVSLSSASLAASTSTSISHNAGTITGSTFTSFTSVTNTATPNSGAGISASSSTSISGSVPLGGSGTAMDFNAKKFGVIVAQKD